MKKNKFIYPLLITVSFILILFSVASCATTTGSPVKQSKKQQYRHYRSAEPKRTTTQPGNETRHYIKKQKSKKPNY
ncbi:MAG: hypothetical protein LBV02_00335 [Bacteroidales bacterium]|jgi:hypothetical protein|nr:hypothetical protein [Bacteroidales bacterium]